MFINKYKKNMYKGITFIIVLLYVILSLNTVTLAAPNISAEYYCLVDRNTGQILFEKNSNEKRPIASTTKIMTAILSLDYANLDEIALVSRHADRTPEFTIKLKEGQEVSLEELLKVTLIKSSNDAAVVLAEHIAGDEEFFGELMSKKAFAIGAMQSNFRNASGLPDTEHYSTAHDLSIIAKYALEYPFIKETVAKAESKFKHPSYKEPITIRNTNGLLVSYKGADGVKTGTTNAAGKCLVASATRNNQQLIAVALHSNDRKADCARLLDYGFNSFKWEKILDHNSVVKELNIQKANIPYLKIYPQKDVFAYIPDTYINIEKVLIIDYGISKELNKNEKIGEMYLYINNKLYQKVALVPGKEILDIEPSYFEKTILRILEII